MHSIQDIPELQRLKRQAWVLGISRWVFGLAFLFTAFNAFPGYKWVLGLGLLVFNQGIEAVGLILRTIFATQNKLDDFAERKTRHTIRLASERGPDIAHDPLFWADVDDRVESEAGPAPAPPSWWKSLGLVAGSLALKTLGDLIGIIFVIAVSES